MHGVSKTSTITIHELDETMTQSFAEAHQHVEAQLMNEGCRPCNESSWVPETPIKELETTHLHQKFYVEPFNLIEPVPEKLGHKDIYVGGV